MENARIILYGCGGHARSVLGTLKEKNITSDIILVDENANDSEYIDGCRVVKSYNLQNGDLYHIAIGDLSKKKELFLRLQSQEIGRPLSIISEYSVIRPSAVLGEGVYIGPFAYVGPQSKLGDNSIINTGSIIEHEVNIGQHSHIAPHATICGRSVVGENSFIGVSATVKDYIHITSSVVLGAGSTVIKDIMDPGVYVGTPARRIEKKKG